MIILIPAYEPDHRLVDLLAAIRTARSTQRIVVVDAFPRNAMGKIVRTELPALLDRPG